MKINKKFLILIFFSFKLTYLSLDKSFFYTGISSLSLGSLVGYLSYKGCNKFKSSLKKILSPVGFLGGGYIGYYLSKIYFGRESNNDKNKLKKSQINNNNNNNLTIPKIESHQVSEKQLILLPNHSEEGSKDINLLGSNKTIEIKEEERDRVETNFHFERNFTQQDKELESYLIDLDLLLNRSFLHDEDKKRIVEKFQNILKTAIELKESLQNITNIFYNDEDSDQFLNMCFLLREIGELGKWGNGNFIESFNDIKKERPDIYDDILKVVTPEDLELINSNIFSIIGLREARIYIKEKFKKNDDAIIFLEKLIKLVNFLIDFFIKEKFINRKSQDSTELSKKYQNYILAKERDKRKKLDNLDTNTVKKKDFEGDALFDLVEYQSGDTGEEAKKLDKEKQLNNQKIEKLKSSLTLEITKEYFRVENGSDIIYYKKIADEKELQNVIITAWCLVLPEIKKNFKQVLSDEPLLLEGTLIDEKNGKLEREIKINLKDQFLDIIQNKDLHIAPKEKNRNNGIWSFEKPFEGGWPVYKYFVEKAELDKENELSEYHSFTPTLCFTDNKENKDIIKNSGISYYVFEGYIKIDLSEELILSFEERYNLFEKNNTLGREGKFVDPYFSKKSD